MTKYNGIALTPIFHSEISSSYMLYDIFENHKHIISQLIYDQFNIHPDKILIERELLFPKKGSIDIFVEFTKADKKYALLLETKVHDYLSARDEQIVTYYDAVSEDLEYDEIFFLYLTQFTAKDDFKGVVPPKTLTEAEKGKELMKECFQHLSWPQMHQFLEKYYNDLTEEQQLIVTLNKQWILQKNQLDKENNKIDVGERGLDDYFTDVKTDIKEDLPFGEEVYENNRQIWRIHISKLNKEERSGIISTIKKYANSTDVNEIKKYKTEEITLDGAKDFLTQLIQNPDNWELTSFYLSLFYFAYTTCFLKFHGTGTRGFSIKLEIKGKGEISLCTIYRNKVIDFALKR